VRERGKGIISLEQWRLFPWPSNASTHTHTQTHTHTFLAIRVSGSKFLCFILIGLNETEWTVKEKQTTRQ